MNVAVCWSWLIGSNRYLLQNKDKNLLQKDSLKRRRRRVFSWNTLVNDIFFINSLWEYFHTQKTLPGSEFKSVYAAWWVMSYFPLYNTFPQGRKPYTTLSLFQWQMFHQFGSTILCTLVHKITGYTIIKEFKKITIISVKGFDRINKHKKWRNRYCKEILHLETNNCTFRYNEQRYKKE